MNSTGLLLEKKIRSEIVYEERTKYAWYILSAGGCLILLSITWLVYRYFSRKTQRTRHDFRNQQLRSRHMIGGITNQADSAGYLYPLQAPNRPLPPPPSSRSRHGGISYQADSAGYLTPIYRDILPQDSADGQTPTSHRNAPLLPPKALIHYENHNVSQSRPQTAMAPININGNLKQLNILQGSVTVSIGGVTCGLEELKEQEFSSDKE